MTVAFDSKSLSTIGHAWWALSHEREWSHTGTGSDLLAVVVVLVRCNKSVDPEVAVQYGGYELTSAGRAWVAQTPDGERYHSFLEVFAGSVDAGAATARVTVSGGTRFFGEYRASCVTYTGVNRAGNLTTTSGDGSGATMSVTTTSLAGRRVVAAFAHAVYAEIEGYSGTRRDPLDLFLALSEGVVGDEAGATSVTVTATSFGKRWCGAALDLIEAAETDDPLLTGSTPTVDVVPPPPAPVAVPVPPPTTSPTTIPVLTLNPAFSQIDDLHLRGDLFRFPYVREKVPYVNIPGESFAEGGVAKLDEYLHRYVGQRILVVAHSMGAQVAYKWMRDEGPTSSIDPLEVTFILTGNLERKYNGFPDGGDYPGGEGGTGLPDDCPWKVIDIARQYDFWADHPDDTDNEIAMRNVDPDGGGLGIGSPVHADYTKVSADPDNAGNFSLVEDTVTYVWSPTYPAPIIDDQDFFDTAKGLNPRDEVVRDEIELGYTRPVTIPGPPPGGVISAKFPWSWDSSAGAWARVARQDAESAPPATLWWLEEEEDT